LKKYGVSGVEINSLADIPSGTGLGSSSSFSAGLINCLHAYRGEYISREKLAEETCELEIDDCGQPIGKQDQYAASYGGFNFYTFNKDGSVDVEPVIMPASTLGEMQNRLRLFYIGGVHSASDILRKQGGNVSHDKEKAEAQMKICDLANELREELQKGNIDVLGKILHENWTLKRTLADGVSNTSIDAYYQKALDLGALGGKILGAGGCGFLLLYTPPEKQETVTAELGLPQVKFGFDRQGSTIIYDTNNEGGSEPQRSN
jgi:D-glycero-alpha-D-manno-heptose-7-phosphate kinase